MSREVSPLSDPSDPSDLSDGSVSPVLFTPRREGLLVFFVAIPLRVFGVFRG